MSEKKKAEQAAEEARKNKPVFTNPFASMNPSTYGANIQQEQSLRGLATQTNALSNAGVRGQSYVSQLGRQNALVGQNIAANLDEQQARIQQLQARGEMMKQQNQYNDYAAEMGGYSNQYNAGQANVMGGVSNLAGTLASGFSEGGAFTGLLGNGSSQAVQPTQPTSFNTMNTQNIGVQNPTPQLQFGTNIGRGFVYQPLTPQP